MFRILLEVVGALAIVFYSGAWYFSNLFRDFAGYTCSDSHFVALASPDGMQSAERLEHHCGRSDTTEVRLRRPNSTDKDSFVPVLRMNHTDPEQVTMTWHTPAELIVNIPKSAEVIEQYGVVFDIRIAVLRSE